MRQSPRPSGAPPTPAEALERLRTGNARFAAGQPINPQQDLARLREVAAQQRPFAALLGCADSRVPVELVYDQGFGDVFVVRVAGNVATSVEIASLEFGTRVLGATALIVLGHSNCGAVKAALQGGEVPGQISTLYQHIAPALTARRWTSTPPSSPTSATRRASCARAPPCWRACSPTASWRWPAGVFELETGKVRAVEV